MSLNTFLRSGFFPLRKVLPPTELHKRLLSGWVVIQTVSGLIAAFTFLVIAGPPIFTVPLDGSVLSRQDLFMLFLSLSFITSLASTLVCSYMYGFQVMGGEEQVVYLVEKFGPWFNVPVMLAGISIMLLLGGALIAIGGHPLAYGVWLAILIVSGILFVLCLSMFFIVWFTVLAGVDNPGKRKVEYVAEPDPAAAFRSSVMLVRQHEADSVPMSSVTLRAAATFNSIDEEIE